MRRIPAFVASLLTILGTVVVAALIARAADTMVGPSIPAAPVTAALAIVALYLVRPLAGLGAFATFALLAETIQHWMGIDLLLFDETALALLVPMAFVQHAIPNRRLRFGVAEAGVVTLIVAGIASSLLASVPPSIWIPSGLLVLKAIALFYATSWMRIGVLDARIVGGAVLAVAGAIGVLGLIELLDPVRFQTVLNLPPYADVRGEVSVVRSLFTHPAQYGWITVFASMFLWARFVVLRTWWAVPAALLLNVGTIISGRRTPLVGLVVALAVAGFWHIRRLGSRRAAFRAWVPVVGAIVVLGFLSIAVLGTFYRTTLGQYLPPAEQVEQIFASEPDALILSTVQPRTALYLSSLAIARDHLPLGVGAGRFGSHFSREEYSPVYEEYGLHRIYLLSPNRPDAVTDTYWPMILGEFGLLGLGGALTFFAAVTRALWRNVGRATGEHRAIALGLLMVFVEGLVRSLTSSVYTAPPIAYFVLVAAGLSIAMQRTVAEGAEADQPAPMSR